MKKTDGSGGKGSRKRKAAGVELSADTVDAPVQASLPAIAALTAPPSVLAPVPLPFVPGSRDLLAEFFVSSAERELVATSFGLDGSSSAAHSEVVELLAFWAADEEYAVPIVGVQEIMKVPMVTELPRAHPAVLGIISLRGTIVPVVDLRRILRLEERPIGRQARILVVHANQADEDPVGLLVDRVTSVVRFEADKIEATPRTMQRQTSELVRGVGRVGKRLIIVLDVKAVVTVMDDAA